MKALGIACTQQAICNGGSHTDHGRIVRISLEEDRRLYTPLARGTYAWEREYRTRTSVERVNSRLDVSFGFEHHFIRRKKKMKARMGLALVVMLAMAVGWIQSGEREKMRSLVQPRAARLPRISRKTKNGNRGDVRKRRRQSKHRKFSPSRA